MAPEEIGRVAIVGGGVMGAGIAEVCARADIDVTVNPRYGAIEDGAVVPSDDGVVDLLEEAGGTAPAAAGD